MHQARDFSVKQQGSHLLSCASSPSLLPQTMQKHDTIAEEMSSSTATGKYWSSFGILWGFGTVCPILNLCHSSQSKSSALPSLVAAWAGAVGFVPQLVHQIFHQEIVGKTNRQTNPSLIFNLNWKENILKVELHAGLLGLQDLVSLRVRLIVLLHKNQRISFWLYVLSPTMK